MICNIFFIFLQNKVGKPTSTPLPLNLEGLGHFAAPDVSTCIRAHKVFIS